MMMTAFTVVSGWGDDSTHLWGSWTCCPSCTTNILDPCSRSWRETQSLDSRTSSGWSPSLQHEEEKHHHESDEQLTGVYSCRSRWILSSDHNLCLYWPMNLFSAGRWRSGLSSKSPAQRCAHSSEMSDDTQYHFCARIRFFLPIKISSRSTETMKQLLSTLISSLQLWTPEIKCWVWEKSE